MWSAGAVARNAGIKFVVSASTNASDGVYLSAQYIVSHNVAPVMSVSFGLCEAGLGASGNSFIRGLWQQAAAEGITVLVSSGDSGAAGCDAASSTRATAGLAVNGLCSTPYNLCVGGTEFNDAANPGVYWSSSNAAGTQASAVSYIPENVWNESGNVGLWASGGGMSAIYSRPYWQNGAGVSADGRRDVPDVSLAAAAHDGYLIYMNGSMMIVGGTSAAAPSFAGLMALVIQSTGARQGNANPTLYALASRQHSGGAAVFHDISSGNNSVPGQGGYKAGPGYDLATGLGSVDAHALAIHWNDVKAVPSLQLAAKPGLVVLDKGARVAMALTTSVGGSFNAPVTLSIAGVPTGISAAFSAPTLPAPGSGTRTVTLQRGSRAKAGAYRLTVTATGGGLQQIVVVILKVTN